MSFSDNLLIFMTALLDAHRYIIALLADSATLVRNTMSIKKSKDRVYMEMEV